MAKALPDSRTPRRFAATRMMTKPTAISTRKRLISGAAEMMLSTPEAMDTATVIV